MKEFNATIVLPFQHQRCTNDNSLEAYHITEALYPLREQHKIELTHSAIDGQKPYVRQYQSDFVRNLSAAREVNPELCDRLSYKVVFLPTDETHPEILDYSQFINH